MLVINMTTNHWQTRHRAHPRRPVRSRDKQKGLPVCGRPRIISRFKTKSVRIISLKFRSQNSKFNMSAQIFTPLPEPVIHARLDPGNAGNAGPRARLQGASPELDRHSNHICRNHHPQSGTTLHRSIPKAADRLWTLTSTILSYKHSRPCRPDPASLRRRARGCKLRPPAPGPPGLRAGTIMLPYNFLLFSYPSFCVRPSNLSATFDMAVRD